MLVDERRAGSDVDRLCRGTRSGAEAAGEEVLAAADPLALAPRREPSAG